MLNKDDLLNKIENIKQKIEEKDKEIEMVNKGIFKTIDNRPTTFSASDANITTI